MFFTDNTGVFLVLIYLKVVNTVLIDDKKFTCLGWLYTTGGSLYDLKLLASVKMITEEHRGTILRNIQMLDTHKGNQMFSEKSWTWFRETKNH